MAASITDLSAIGNGTALDTIDLTWTNGSPGDLASVKVYYRASASWVLWVTLADTATYKNGFPTLDNTAYDFWVEGVARIGPDSSDYVYDVGNFGDTNSETLAFSDSSSESAGFTDTRTETLGLSATGGEVVTASDTHTETLSISDSASAAAVTPLTTTYRYYLGSFEGKMYAEQADVFSDDGTAIDAIWESKDLDFGDMYPEMVDRKKTLYKVRLNYVDLTAGADVSVDVSTDGGTTWTERGKSIGTGDGTTKNVTFHFVKTGVYFRFRVRNNTISDQFQWTRLTPLWTDAGENH